MSMAEAASEWGEGRAEDTMASNSRVRARRARQLGWKPKARSLIEEIEHGCYLAIVFRRPCESRDPYAAASH